MKIWILNPFDELPGEGPEQRYACLARLLAARGHEVLWVSADFHHRLKARRSSETLSPQGYALRLIPTPTYSRNLSFRRLWSHACWGRRLVRVLRREVDAGRLAKPDLILASLPPLDGLAAALRLRSRFGGEVVADIMDDWPRTWLQALPDHPAARFTGHILLAPWALWSRSLLRRVNRASAQSRRYAERAKALGAPGAPHVCYLGASPRDGQKTNIENTSTESDPTNSEAPLRLIYLGAMGRIYDIEGILQAALLAKKRDLPWRWSLVGSDPNGRWQSRAAELDLLDVVDYPGYLTGADLDARLRSADLGLIPMDPRSGVAVPYKAAEYLSAGLGILCSLPGELTDRLQNSGAGAYVPLGDADALIHEAVALTRTDEKRRQLRTAALKLFAECFDKTRIYPRFVEWLGG